MLQHQYSISEAISKRYFQEIETMNRYDGIEKFYEIEAQLIREIYQLETEAAKERIDAAANRNANLIRRFGDSISNCKSAEELQRNWEELSSHLINF